MENRIQILVEEINQIRAQYVNEVGPGGGKAWPKAIKARVLELDQLVKSTKQTAELSGLAVDTLYQWRSEAKKEKFKQISVVNNKSVTVTDTNPRSRSVIPENQRSVTVTVTTPKGFVIEGLPSELALDFLIKMGAR